MCVMCAGLFELDKSRLAVVGLRLLQECVRGREWQEAYLLLFFMHQRQLNYSRCTLVRVHEAATLVLVVLAQTGHLADTAKVLDLAEWYTIKYSRGPPTELRATRLLALRDTLNILYQEIQAKGAEMTANSKKILLNIMAKVFGKLVESHKEGG